MVQVLTKEQITKAIRSGNPGFRDGLLDALAKKKLTRPGLSAALEAIRQLREVLTEGGTIIRLNGPCCRLLDATTKDGEVRELVIMTRSQAFLQDDEGRLGIRTKTPNEAELSFTRCGIVLSSCMADVIVSRETNPAPHINPDLVLSVLSDQVELTGPKRDHMHSAREIESRYGNRTDETRFEYVRELLFSLGYVRAG